MGLFYGFCAIDHFRIHFVGTEEIPFAVIFLVVLVGAFKVHSVLRNRHDTFCTHAILEGALELAAIGVKQGGVGLFLGCLPLYWHLGMESPQTGHFLLGAWADMPKENTAKSRYNSIFFIMSYEFILRFLCH